MNRYNAFLMVSFAILLIACQSFEGEPLPNSTDIPGTTSRSVLRIGWAGSPDSLNPGAAILSRSYTIFEMVYDSLMRLELDGTYTPELAESYTSSEDGLVWTFKIRTGIQWHDGTPLTARDIAFTYNFYQSHEDFPYLPIYTYSFASVDAPDDNTVVITLTEPLPNLFSQLIYLYVLPEHVWGKLEGSQAAEYANTEMIGSGPFKLLEYKPDEFVHLGANPDYYANGPNVDEIIFQTFAQADVLVQALITGQVDMITEVQGTALPTLKNAENIAILTGPPLFLETTYISFNQIAPENCLEGTACSGHPALRDRTVRETLAHATDKQKMIDVTMLGLASPGLTLLPRGLAPWFNTSITDYAYDVGLANQMLDEAGYLDTDGDGVREMPGSGQPLIFRAYGPNDMVVVPRLAELTDEMWQEVGVQLDIQIFDPDSLWATCCPEHDFDILFWGWSSDPDPKTILSVMVSTEIESGNNDTGYVNPAYDDLFAQQATTLDTETRVALIWEMQQMVFDDVVFLVPFYPNAVQAYRTDRFTGWLTDKNRVALEDISSLLLVEPVR